MGSAGEEHPRLLDEQVSFYRAIAADYLRQGLDLPGGDELTEALEAFRPTGSVPELACGPGVWTGQLLRHATDVTAVDASPEMLAIAAARVCDGRVRFIQADLFTWAPDRRYDVVFIGFWLSHVRTSKSGFGESAGTSKSPPRPGRSTGDREPEPDEPAASDRAGLRASAGDRPGGAGLATCRSLVRGAWLRTLRFRRSGPNPGEACRTGRRAASWPARRHTPATRLCRPGPERRRQAGSGRPAMPATPAAYLQRDHQAQNP